MTTVPDRPSLEEYPDWLADSHGIDLEGGSAESFYDLITPGLKDQFTSSTFWTTLGERLSDWNEQYRSEHSDYPLLENLQLPVVDIKKYSSAVGKTYRWNVVKNARWPSPPIAPGEDETALSWPEEVGDWYQPENWLGHFPDIIRTRLTVRYMDGVAAIAGRLLGLADELGIEAKQEFIARPDGYHAAHVLISQPFRVWDRESQAETQVGGRVEIQITTRIQETISQMLHAIYERWRVQGELPAGWQWNHESREFAVNYLGHTLHYLEGMIVVARERLD